jgi:cysteine-rich repeat protein
LSAFALTIAVVLACGGSQSAGDDDTGGDAAAAGSGAGAADGAADTRPEVPDVVATCGNGVLDPGEECDDGNRMDGDGCDWSCRLGPGTLPRFGSDDPSVPGLEGSGGLEPIDLTGSAAATWGNAVLVWGDTVYATLLQSPDAVFARFGIDGVRVGDAWRYTDAEHEPNGRLDLVWNGDGYGLAWCASDATLWFVELDRMGKMRYAPLQPAVIDLPCDPTLVWDGERYALLWTVATDGPDSSLDPALAQDLRFVALGPGGVALTDVVVVHHNPDGWVHAPEAATSGADILVGFLDHPWRCGLSPDTGVGCSSVATASRDGAVVRGPMILSASRHNAPRTAWGEDRFGVLFDSVAAGGESQGLHLALFAETGELLGSPIPVRVIGLARVLAHSAITLAWGRGGWAIAFFENYSGPPGDPVNGIVRLDRAGGFVDQLAILDEMIGMPCHADDSIDMAFDGGGFGLLCWMSGDDPWFGRFPLEP